MGQRTLHGILMGYHQQAGGRWSGGLIVADWEQFANARCMSEVHLRRFNSKEVNLVADSDSSQPIDENTFYFPVAEMDLPQPGNGVHQERHSLLIEKTKQKKKETKDREEAERIAKEQELAQDKWTADIPEDLPVAEADFWICNSSYLTRHHKNPRTNLFVPSVDDCPLPLTYLDILRFTKTSLEGLQEGQVNDLWTSIDQDPNRELSAPWTGETRFTLLRPDPPPGYKWV